MKTIMHVAALFFMMALAYSAPILESVVKGDVPQVKQLLAADAKQANALDEHGISVLTLALKQHNPDLCKVLLEAGADPNLRLTLKGGNADNTPDSQRKGTTALHVYAATALDLPDGKGATVREKHANASAARIACLKLLLAAKADVTATDDAGNTPLHVAIQAANDKHPNLETIALLVSKATINLPGSKGEPPLADAMIVQQYDVAKILIGNGADVNMADQDGMTPLHYAVMAHNARLVDMLLTNQANPAIANKAGKTPRQLAKEQNDVLIKQLLGVK
jgi:ankyrin repeat protein